MSCDENVLVLQAFLSKLISEHVFVLKIISLFVISLPGKVTHCELFCFVEAYSAVNRRSLKIHLIADTSDIVFISPEHKAHLDIERVFVPIIPDMINITLPQKHGSFYPPYNMWGVQDKCLYVRVMLTRKMTFVEEDFQYCSSRAATATIVAFTSLVKITLTDFVLYIVCFH